MRRIELLGTTTITKDGKSLRIANSPKGVALLTYLIVTGKQQQREHLASLLWSGVSTSRALQNLRELLVRVRRDVPEVQTTRQTAEFVPTAETVVDFLELDAGLKNDDPTAPARVLKRYKGELLEGFHIEGARLFDEWLMVEREHIYRRVLSALHGLCHHYHAIEMWGLGLTAARYWLYHDPWSNEAVRHFMRFSAELNQFSVARQMYETFRQRLDQELGVAPERETTRLLSQLESERNAQRWRSLAEQPLAPPADLPPSSVVPFQRNRDFVGRENALKKVVEQFAESAEHAVALTGISGIGKTQTAVEFAYRYGQQFHGVYWLNFGDPHGIADEVAAIGGERGMRLYQESDQLSTAEQVRRVQRAWQESTPRLLIFDNCENEQLLTDWLPVTGGCRVLVTSRRGQWSHNVATVSLDVLGRATSVRLLQRLAPSLRVEEGGRISAELADHPLALHLAGNFLNRYSTITPTDYLRQLNQRDLLDHPSLCGRGAEYSPTDYYMSVARTFALSYQRLDIESVAHHLLLALACCAAGEAVPQAVAVQFVGSDFAELTTIDALTDLQSLGLLSFHNGRILMHRLVAQFVRSRSQLDTIRPRIAATLTDLLDEQNTKRGSLHPLPLPSAHIETVLQMELPDGAPYLPLLRHWAHYLADVEQPQRFIPFIETAKEMLENPNEIEFAPVQRADCLRSFGNITLYLEGVASARPFYEQALSIFQQLDEPLKTAQVINNLGALALMNDEPEQARAYFQQAIAAYEQLPADTLTRTYIVNALGNLTVSHTRHREYDAARRYSERAVAIVNAHLADDPATLGWTIYNHGLVTYGLRDYDAARANFHKAYELYCAVYGDKVTTGRVMVSVGTVEYVFGNVDEGYKWLTEGLAIFEQHGVDDASAASGYLELGKVLMMRGRFGEAVRSLERGVALFENAGSLLPSRAETIWLLNWLK